MRTTPRSLRIAAMLTATLGVLLVANAAAAQRVLSMATLAPAGSTWARILEASGRELRRRTGGQVSIRWYPGGVQGDEAEVIRKIRSGRLDGAAVTGSGLAQIHRPVLAFELPAIFESVEQFVRARDALRPDVEAAFERAGFELLGFDGAGAPRLLSTHPVHTPSDLRTSRPWLWPDNAIMPLLYGQIGASGVPLQLPEVLGALETGRVDVVYGSPLAAIALQWAPYVHYISAEAASASVGGVVVSRALFQMLTPDQQRMVREIVDEFHVLLARNLRHDEDVAAHALLDRGLQVVPVTPGERTQWLAVFSGVRARAVGTIADAAWIARVQSAARGP